MLLVFQSIEKLNKKKNPEKSHLIQVIMERTGCFVQL